MEHQLHVFQLITNVMVIDGTNTPARKAFVRVKDDRIEAVGDLTANPEDNIVDGDGFVLTPGFIDTHSHLAFPKYTEANTLDCIHTPALFE